MCACTADNVVGNVMLSSLNGPISHQPVAVMKDKQRKDDVHRYR